MIDIFLKKIVKNQKGSMDKILVTLLLVIISVGGVIGLSSWADSETEDLKNTTSVKVQEAKDSM